MAAFLPMMGWVAEYTEPMPPSATLPTMTYSPTCVPSASSTPVAAGSPISPFYIGSVQMRGCRHFFQWQARELHDEARAVAGSALHADGAAVRFHDLAGDPEPEPKAAIVLRRGHPLEFVEDGRLFFGVN